MREQDEHKKETLSEEKSFCECVGALPMALKGRFLKQIVGSLAVALIILFFAFVSKDWRCLLGLAFSLYIAYIGMDIVWKYDAGIIVRKKVRCISAAKVLGNKERLIVALRNLDRRNADEPETYKFYFPVSKKDSGLIAPDVVMDIYINSKNPSEILAWELTDIYRPPND